MFTPQGRSQWSATHPRNAYEKPSMNQSQFLQELGKGLNSYYVRGPGKTRYRSVKVLLTLWENDRYDLECIGELDGLREMFAEGFGYSCTTYHIPISHTNPQLALISELNRLCLNSGEQDLVIFYYAGHGASRNSEPCYFLPGRFDSKKNKVSLPGVEVNFAQVKRAVLDSCKADTLSILDCCHAGAAGYSAGSELLAACVSERTVPSPKGRSFTAGLIIVLEEALAKKEIMTTAQVYAALFQMTFEEIGTTGVRRLRETPVHVEMHDTPRMPIYFAPMSGHSAWSGRAPRTVQNAPSTVFLAVTLSDGSESTLSEVHQWLTNSRPSAVSRVNLLNNDPSGSSTLLFETTIETFYCLRPHAALKWVGWKGVVRHVSPLVERPLRASGSNVGPSTNIKNVQ